MRFSIAFLVCLTMLIALGVQIPRTIKQQEKHLAKIEGLREKITNQKQRLGCDNPDCDLEGLLQQSGHLSNQVEKVAQLERATIRSDTLARQRHNKSFHSDIRSLEISRKFYAKLGAEGSEKYAAVAKRFDGWSEGTVRTSQLDWPLGIRGPNIKFRVHNRFQIWIPTKRPVWLVFAGYDERIKPLLEKTKKDDWEKIPIHLEARLLQRTDLVRWKPMQHRLSPGEHVVEALYRKHAKGDQIKCEIILDGELLLTTVVEDNQLYPVSFICRSQERLHGNTFDRYDESGKPVNYEAAPLPTLSKVGFSESPDTRSPRARLDPYHAGDFEFYAVLGLTDKDPGCAEFPEQ